MVFVASALETIAASKDARKKKPLGDAVQKALSAVKSKGDAAQIDPELLFNALQLATDASTISIVTTALDCIGKLISYSFFTAPAEIGPNGQQIPPLIERAIDTNATVFKARLHRWRCRCRY